LTTQTNVESARGEAVGFTGTVRLLIVFNTICKYGMELSVIESFDSLRPEIQPLFLLPRATERYDTGLLKEIERRDLPHAFFSDHFDWPRIGRPRTWRSAMLIPFAILRANLDVWKAARGQDAIYAPIVTGLYFSLLASLWFRWQRKKVIYSFHELEAKPSRVLRFGCLLVSDLVHLTALSREMVARANPFVTRKRNYVIRPVVDVESRAEGGRDALRAFAGWRNIVYLGRASKHKGVDVLIEAFFRIGGRFDNAVLHIVGGVEPEYQDEFTAAIGKTGVADRIRLWGYCSDVQPFLEIAYLSVYPTPPSLVHESFGRGVVEAMSMGVPSVAFRSGALAEIVEQETTGLLCDEENAACLASNLERLLAAPELRDRLGRQARERFEETYSSRRIRDDWREFFSRSASEQ
jgi:glycosyltransferase involved in cell wall biosynthesis